MNNIVGLTDHRRPLECPCRTCQFCLDVATGLLDRLPDVATDPKLGKANRKRMKDLFKLLKPAGDAGDHDLVVMFVHITSHMLTHPIPVEVLCEMASEPDERAEEVAKALAHHIIQTLIPIKEGGSIENAPPEVREQVTAWERDRIAHHPFKSRA